MSSIASSLKMAMLLAEAIRNPEDALIKVIDDFSEADNSEVSEIKEGLCKKMECDDMNIVPGDSIISLKFTGVEEPIDDFAVKIAGFVYNLLCKLRPVVSIALPKDVDIDNILHGLSVVNDETKNATFIEIPYKEKMLSLEVKSDIEEKTASIEIPIENERILEKLREIKNN